jgi:hypothetical protein
MVVEGVSPRRSARVKSLISGEISGKKELEGVLDDLFEADAVRRHPASRGAIP